MGRILTEDAAVRRAAFDEHYGEGNCSCFNVAPCGSCTHPGNPANQEEDDECWENISVRIFPTEEGGYEIDMYSNRLHVRRDAEDASAVGSEIMAGMAQINLEG
jgi:hypothetical protein